MLRATVLATLRLETPLSFTGAPTLKAMQRVDLSEVDYEVAGKEMRGWVEERVEGTSPDRLFLLSHPPVITYGPRTSLEDLPAVAGERADRGAWVVGISIGTTGHAEGGEQSGRGVDRRSSEAVLDRDADPARCDQPRVLGECGFVHE